MKNISTGERIVRVSIGVLIIGWGFFAKNWWGAVGLAPLLTGLIGWCGLYKLMASCCPFSKKMDDKKDGKSKSGGCCCGGKSQ